MNGGKQMALSGMAKLLSELIKSDTRRVAMSDEEKIMALNYAITLLKKNRSKQKELLLALKVLMKKREEKRVRKEKVLGMTLYRVIKNLEQIKDVPVASLVDEAQKAFNGYSFEGEEELVGAESWPDLHEDGEYRLNIGLDHPDAYVLTLYTVVKAQKATITKVL